MTYIERSHSIRKQQAHAIFKVKFNLLSHYQFRSYNLLQRAYKLLDNFIYKYHMRKIPPKSKAPVFKPEDYIKCGLPNAQIQQLKEAFDLFDIDNTGKIDPKQLKASLSALGYQSKNQVFFLMVSDLQKSGPVDFSKFLQIMSARVGLRSSRQNMKKVFALLDDQKTGFISLKNLRKVVKQIGENIEQSDLSDMIQKADVDNDGLVSEEQFYSIMTKKTKKY